MRSVNLHTTNLALSFIAKYFLVTPLQEAIIILPEAQLKRSIETLLNALGAKNVKVVPLSAPETFLKTILPYLSKDNKNKANELLIERKSRLSTGAQSYLLARLTKGLLKNRGIDLQDALSIVKQITPFIDCLLTEQITLNQLNIKATSSASSSESIDLIKSVYPQFLNVLSTTSLISASAYNKKLIDFISAQLLDQTEQNKSQSLSLSLWETDVVNLTSNPLETFKDIPILVLPASNYSYSYITLLKGLLNKSNACALFSGINHHLSEQEWTAAGKVFSSPYFIKYQTLQKLCLTRADIKNAEQKDLLSQEDIETITLKSEKLKNILRPLLSLKEVEEKNTFMQSVFCSTPQPITKESCSHISVCETLTELEEIDVILELIMSELLANESTRIAVVANNYQLSQKVELKLKLKGISSHSQSSLSLLSTDAAQLFMLLTRMDTTHVDWVDLTAILCHPLCGLSEKTVTNLIDLHFARNLSLNGTSIKEALESLRYKTEFLKDPPQGKKPSTLLEESEKVKAVLEKIDHVFKPFSDLKNTIRPVKDFLQAHITLWQEATQAHTQGANELLNKPLSPHVLLINKVLEKVQEQELLLSYSVSSLEYEALIKEWLKEANTAPLPNETTPNVTICSAAQAAAEPWDIVVVTSLNEGAFPNISADNTNTLNYVLAQNSLDTSQNNIGRYASYFHDLCCQPKTYLLRSRKKLSTSTIKSRFLIKLENTLKFNQLPLPIYSPNTKPISKTSKGDLTDNFQPPCPPVSLRPRQIYSTQVETLIKNPYVFFVNHVLNLRSLEPVNAQFTPKDIGNAVHACLEDLIVDLSANHLGGKFVIQEEEIYNKLFKKLRTSAKFNSNSASSVKVALAKLIFLTSLKALSKNLAKKLSESINVYAESRRSAPLKTDLGEITLSAKLDCVLLNELGEATIIDFKTGNTRDLKQKLNSKNRNGGQLKEVQQLSIAAYLMTSEAVTNELLDVDTLEAAKQTKIKSLEYWCFNNKVPDSVKNELIQPLEVLSPDTDNLYSFFNNEIGKLKEYLSKYLLSEEPFNNLQKPFETTKEIQYFGRLSLILKTRNY